MGAWVSGRMPGGNDHAAWVGKSARRAHRACLAALPDHLCLRSPLALTPRASSQPSPAAPSNGSPPAPAAGGPCPSAAPPPCGAAGWPRPPAAPSAWSRRRRGRWHRRRPRSSPGPASVPTRLGRISALRVGVLQRSSFKCTSPLWQAVLGAARALSATSGWLHQTSCMAGVRPGRPTAAALPPHLRGGGLQALQRSLERLVLGLQLRQARVPRLARHLRLRAWRVGWVGGRLGGRLGLKAGDGAKA